MAALLKMGARRWAQPTVLAVVLAVFSSVTGFGDTGTADWVPSPDSCTKVLSALTPADSSFSGVPPVDSVPVVSVASANTLSDALAEKGIVRGGTIAAGGMGTVSGGTVTHRDRKTTDVVIKEPIGAGAARARNIKALRQEALVWQKLYPDGHAEMVEAKDGSVALIVTRVKGSSLETLLAQDKKFSEDPAKRDSKRIDAVANALVGSMRPFQEAKLVHGDINPKNVLVDIQGDTAAARLIDFGLTKREQTNGDQTASGTPGYLGVEATLGKTYTEHRDVHAMQQTLLRLYYRDLYGRLDNPKTPNSVKRGYAGFFQYPDMHRTLENGSFGVKPEIAWVLRFSAIRRTEDLAKLLDKAQRSTDMTKFLDELLPTFEETWKRADPQERESLMVDLVRSPMYRTAFASKLPPAMKKELVALLHHYEGKGVGVMLPYAVYQDLVPMIGEFRKNFQRSEMSRIASALSRLRFR